MLVAKIPSALLKIELPPSIQTSSDISPTEGLVIVVEVKSAAGRFNLVEDCTGNIDLVTEGDILPVVLGRRRAIREQSGDVPTQLAVGDTVHLLCESGVAGISLGFYAEDHRPVELKVLGAAVVGGRLVNTKDASLPRRQSLHDSAPIVGVVGTCMDAGKTTMACKLIREFQEKGLKVAAVKLSGVAFLGDLLKMQRAGAEPVMSFMDGGLPSTCGDIAGAIEVALGVLHEVNRKQPDLIIAEFGDGLLGEYGVKELVQCADLKENVIAFIVAAGDLVSAYGAHNLMKLYGADVALTTGPAVNNPTTVCYVEKHMGGLAESNQHEICKTVAMVERKIITFRQRKKPL